MKKYTLSLLVVLCVAFRVSAQCPMSTLNISTGYDPATGTTTTPSNTTFDPMWRSGVSAAAATAIAAMPDIVGCYDALPCPSWPAPYGGTTWLMGQNDWGYMTTGTFGYGFTDTFTRPFMLCNADSVSLVINQLRTDDGIMYILLDGFTVLYSNLAPPGGITTYPAVTYPLGMLASGTHTISIVNFNFNNGVYKNAIGINMNATLVSMSSSLTLSNGLCSFFATNHNDTFVCPGTPVTLYADTAGSRVWSTLDTASSITVTTPGTYWVHITTGPCSSRVDTVHIINTSLLSVNLGADTSFCDGSSLTLAPPEPTGTSFSWSTGSTAPGIAVSAAGTYWVTVTSFGCTASDTINIATRANPVVDLGPDTSQCFGGGSTFTLQSSVSYTSPTYLWSTSAATSSITVSTTGAYWLKVTDNGCVGADTIQVTVASDTFHLFNGDTAICRGKTVPVFLNANPTATFQWLPTAGIVNPTLQSPAIKPDTSAMYYVVISLPGCPDVVDSFYIDVQPMPVLFAGGNKQVCQFDTLHLHATVTPNWYTHYSYSWTPTVNVDDATMPDVIFRADADTKMYLSITTPAGCSTLDSVEVLVHPGNFATLDANFNVCPHDSVQMAPMGGASYKWHPGLYLDDSTSGSPWVHAITSTSYTAVATSAFGCLDTVTANVIVHPAAILNLGDSVKLFPGESYHIRPQTNCMYFRWFPPAGLDYDRIADPTAQPSISTKYVVHASTEWGCKASDSISVYYDISSLIDIPNAFTPGADINANLYLLRRGEVTLHHFRIYNRWGVVMFETTNINEGWDGNYKGKPQPFGVYVYQVEAETNTGKAFNKTGNITLLR